MRFTLVFVFLFRISSGLLDTTRLDHSKSSKDSKSRYSDRTENDQISFGLPGNIRTFSNSNDGNLQLPFPVVSREEGETSDRNIVRDTLGSVVSMASAASGSYSEDCDEAEDKKKGKYSIGDTLKGPLRVVETALNTGNILKDSAKYVAEKKKKVFHLKDLIIPHVRMALTYGKVLKDSVELAVETASKAGRILNDSLEPIVEKAGKATRILKGSLGVAQNVGKVFHSHSGIIKDSLEHFKSIGKSLHGGFLTGHGKPAAEKSDKIVSISKIALEPVIENTAKAISNTKVIVKNIGKSGKATSHMKDSLEHVAEKKDKVVSHMKDSLEHVFEKSGKAVLHRKDSMKSGNERKGKSDIWKDSSELLTGKRNKDSYSRSSATSDASAIFQDNLNVEIQETGIANSSSVAVAVAGAEISNLQSSIMKDSSETSSKKNRQNTYSSASTTSNSEESFEDIVNDEIQATAAVVNGSVPKRESAARKGNTNSQVSIAQSSSEAVAKRNNKNTYRSSFETSDESENNFDDLLDYETNEPSVATKRSGRGNRGLDDFYQY